MLGFGAGASKPLVQRAQSVDKKSNLTVGKLPFMTDSSLALAIGYAPPVSTVVWIN
jgi:hypothetical protein